MVESQLRQLEPDVPVIVEETVERGGSKLTQYRMPPIKSPLPGIGSPTIIRYTSLGDDDASSDAMLNALSKAMDIPPDLWRHGQIAIDPVVIFFAVKPGRKLRAWATGLVQPLLIHDRDRLIHDLGAIAAPDVAHTVVVGIVFPDTEQHVNAFDLPMPSEWAAAMHASPKPLLFPDELFAVVWPE